MARRHGADADEAVAGPAASAPTPSRHAGSSTWLRPAHADWGRDELGSGEMWNSNSVIAWLLARVEVDVQAISPPHGGRAPGWRAGVECAARGTFVEP